MGVVKIIDKVSPQDLTIAREDYEEYIKVVADIQTGAMAIGGEWHADGEKVLLESGSKQDDIWGGGVDMITNKIETIAIINLRPRVGNDSQEILDPRTRERFVQFVKEKFKI